MSVTEAIRKVLPILLALAFVAACAPQAQQAGDEVAAPPVVAVINAPAEDRVTPLAERLEEEVERVPGCCSFEFRHAPPIRFQETHRNLFGSQAVPQSAALARNLGSEIAVLASAPLFEREERRLDGEIELRGRVQVEAFALDAETEERLGTVLSTTFSGRRQVPQGQELPRPEEDPLMLDLLDQAASDLAPHLAALLEDIATGYAGAD